MRIGLVLDRFDPIRGGREQWTYCFAQRLVARGHEVHVVARELGEPVYGLPVALHRVACHHSPLAFAEKARAALEQLGLDIVHDMGTGWYCDVFQPHGGTWASVADHKLLFLPRWLRWMKRQVDRLLPRQRDFHRLMQRQYADRGQVLLALSRAGAEDFTRYHDVAPDRIRVIANGVDAERFSPERCGPLRQAMRERLGLGPNAVLALLVAHNLRLKGAATLLRAAAKLKSSGLPIHVAIVGSRRLQPWQRMAAGLGLGGEVTLVGLVDDPLPYYAAADMYVHPTFHDACSLVVLEAAACGLPVVTSGYNGAAELFVDGKDIRLIADPASAEELAAVMRELCDGAERRRIGEAARQTALVHTFDRNVDRIVAVYEEILRRRSGLPHDYKVWTDRIVAGEEPPGATAGLPSSAGSTVGQTNRGTHRDGPRPQTAPTGALP